MIERCLRLSSSPCYPIERGNLKLVVDIWDLQLASLPASRNEEDDSSRQTQCGGHAGHAALFGSEHPGSKHKAGGVRLVFSKSRLATDPPSSSQLDRAPSHYLSSHLISFTVTRTASTLQLPNYQLVVATSSSSLTVHVPYLLHTDKLPRSYSTVSCLLCV